VEKTITVFHSNKESSSTFISIIKSTCNFQVEAKANYLVIIYSAEHEHFAAPRDDQSSMRHRRHFHSNEESSSIFIAIIKSTYNFRLNQKQIT
jgi:hypothetical protein